ncbi:MAG: FHA domain-containing protein [Phycisphaerae bacterium]
MQTCSKCGELLEHPEARFCSACGATVEQDERGDQGEQVDAATPPAPAEEGESPGALAGGEEPAGAGLDESSYASAVERAMADGVLDASDREALNEIRDSLQLDTHRAEQLEQDALASTGPGEGPAEVTTESAAPLRLEINDSRFYMSGRSGVLDFQLSNTGDTAITALEMVVRGAYIEKAQRKVHRLKPRASHRVRLPVRPTLAGEHMLDFLVSCEVGEDHYAGSAQPILRVLDEDVAPEQLSIVIDQSMKAGKNIGYGMDVQREVQDGMLKGLIRSANDLLMKRFPEHWRAITLSDDPELAEQRWGPKTVKVRPLATADGPACTRTCISAEGDGLPNVFILTGREITFGRSSTDNDVLLRALPRSNQKDAMSRRIQGVAHFTLRLAEDGLVVADGETTNGTWVDGRRLDSGQEVPLRGPCEVSIADAVRLRLVPMWEKDPLPADRLSLLGEVDELWKHAEKHRLRSVMIERLDGLALEERYMVVYRWAVIGRGAGVEVPLPGACSRRRCLRLLRLGEHLWLESLTDDGCLAVEGENLAAHAALPLEQATTASCREVKLTFADKSQRKS